MVSSASKLSVLVLFLLMAPPLAGQEGPIEQGSMIIGGSVGFSSFGGELYEDSDGDRFSSILLNPRALFFVASGLAIGGDLFVERQSQGDFEATTIAVGPAVAYFFGDIDSDAYPFLSATVGYGSVSTSGFDGSGVVFGGSAGVAFMLSRSVALTAAGSYRMEHISIDQADQKFSGNVISLQLGVEAFLH